MIVDFIEIQTGRLLWRDRDCRALFLSDVVVQLGSRRRAKWRIVRMDDDSLTPVATVEPWNKRACRRHERALSARGAK